MMSQSADTGNDLGDLPKGPPRSSHFVLIAGLCLTVLWAGVLLSYALTNWPSMLEMEPNELGDFFAGGFAPLAFFWLVLGFFQQGEELRNSGRALWLQGRELQNSVAQQRDLVEVTRQQLALEGSLRRPILKISGEFKNAPLEPEKFHYLEVVMRNHGELCTDIKVASPYMEQTVQWSVLEPDKTVTFGLTIPRDDPGPFVIDVTYRDRRNAPGRVVFTLTDKGEHFIIEDVEGAETLPA